MLINFRYLRIIILSVMNINSSTLLNAEGTHYRSSSSRHISYTPQSELNFWMCLDRLEINC
jgi:hypothetical protein